MVMPWRESNSDKPLSRNAGEGYLTVLSLLYDLPAAVGLLASGAVALLGLAADGDRLLEFPAIGAVGGLVVVSRHHRARGPGLLVAPRQGLAGLAGLERGLSCPVRVSDIGLVQ